MRVELLLDHRLRTRLLAGGLMLRQELHVAGLTDSDDRDIFDALYDPKAALGHEYSLPQFARRLPTDAAFNRFGWDFPVGSSQPDTDEYEDMAMSHTLA